MASNTKNEMEEKSELIEKTQNIISKESVMKNLTNTKDGYTSLLVKNIFNGSNDYGYQKSTAGDSKIIKNIDESHLFLKLNNGRLLNSLASEDENMDICISSGNEKNVSNKTPTRVTLQQQIVGNKPLIIGDSTLIEKKIQDEKKKTENKIMVNNRNKSILLKNNLNSTFIKLNTKLNPNGNIKTYSKIGSRNNKFKKTHLIPYKKKYFSKTQSLAENTEINCDSVWPFQSQELFHPKEVIRPKQPMYVEGQQYILQDGCPDFCLFDLLKSFASDDDSDIEDLSHDQTVLTFASTEVKLLGRPKQGPNSKANYTNNKINLVSILSKKPSSEANVQLINNPSTGNEKSKVNEPSVSDYIRTLNTELLTNATQEKISQLITMSKFNTTVTDKISKEPSHDEIDEELWNNVSSKFPPYKSSSFANHDSSTPKNMQTQAARPLSIINLTNNSSIPTSFPKSIEDRSNCKTSVTLATLEIQSGKDLTLPCTICNDNFVLTDTLKCMSANNKEKLEIKFIVYCFIYSDNGQQKKLHIFGRNFPCKICREACSSEPELYCHMKGHSLGPLTSFIQCPFCTYNCNRQGFRHHVNRHFPRFKCPLCGVGYNLAQQFHSHIINHTILKIYSCEFCIEKFNQIETLLLHLHVVHPYVVQCPLCTEKFFSFTDLENHRYTHTFIK